MERVTMHHLGQASGVIAAHIVFVLQDQSALLHEQTVSVTGQVIFPVLQANVRLNCNSCVECIPKSYHLVRNTFPISQPMIYKNHIISCEDSKFWKHMYTDIRTRAHTQKAKKKLQWPLPARGGYNKYGAFLQRGVDIMVHSNSNTDAAQCYQILAGCEQCNKKVLIYEIVDAFTKPSHKEINR
jgi:hypothetical protein